MKTLILTIGLTLALTSPAWAQVVIDTPTSGYCASDGAADCVGGTVLTLAHTTNANSNRALAVTAFIGCGGAEVAPDIASMTYAGVSLGTAIESTTPASNRRGQLWALPAGTMPATGANNLIVTLAGSIAVACSTQARLHVGVWTASGVDQTTTFVDTNVNSGSSTTASLSFTGNGATDFGFAGVCSGDGLTSTTETSLYDIDVTTTTCNSQGGAKAANDTAFSWTIPSDSWIMTGGVFKVAGAGGAAKTPSLPILGAGQ